MPVTCHVVVPIGRGDAGSLVPLEPAEAASGGTAVRRARRAAERRAVAFSRTGVPNTGEFSDAVILAPYGEVDRKMLGE